ncbi:MAG: hypothetical protein KAY37_00395 [Phycisphaerae bacterium]|nr:hypothetical protein [Phycisphaerae bacterium]
MVTGYWPHTNEMIRPFSDNPVQNPAGWIGEDWEGRGYNIYSYFPEFPGGPENNPKGDGDFEVDYQDTSADFWRITEEIEPIAIIGFGLAEPDNDWEVEGGNRKYSLNYWDPDFLSPRQPTEDLPIAGEPNGYRWASLPMQEIVDAVAAEVPSLNPYYTTNDSSKFLCNFMGYHANWYHDLHADPSDPAWNITAGFIHVGSDMSLDDAMLATEVTFHTVIDYIDTIVPEPSSALLLLGVLPLLRRRTAPVPAVGTWERDKV